jgi:SAM-dependent methyltransferase
MSTRPRYKDRWYPETRFGGFSTVDGTVAFYSRIAALLEPDFVALDLGCGRGAAAEDPVLWRRKLQTLRGRCARVIGVDVDESGATNPQIDEFRLIGNDLRLPLEDGSIDLCVSDAVVEHVQDVELFFSECARVIRPGGYLFIRTPNVHSYAGIGSRLVPNNMHAKVLGRVQPDRKEDDIFPTVYRCNTRRKLQRGLERHGFAGIVQTHESEPSYLSFSRFSYALGVFHQRYAPQSVRRTLLASARKSSKVIP